MKKRSGSKGKQRPTTLAARFRQRVVRQYFVRFHMSLLLMATTCCGVLASKLLLMAGLTSVLIRYPLAVLVAYLVFVGLTRLWVAYVLIDVPDRRGRGVGGSSFDVANLDLPWPRGGPSGGGSFHFGGGDSGGGGASDVWGVAEQAALPARAPSGGGGGGGWHFPSLDLNIDFDEGIWIVVLLAALALVLFCVGGYMVFAAPEILPDLALNALLASCLTGAAKRAQSRGWLRSVVGATWIQLLLILAVTVGLAWTIHRTCPGAPKLMDALHCADVPPRH